jgi:hypothetical protein
VSVRSETHFYLSDSICGERDVIHLAKMCEQGVPFWLAEGYGSAEINCWPRELARDASHKVVRYLP